MKTNVFKRIVMQSFNPKNLKDGIKANIRKRGLSMATFLIMLAVEALTDLLAVLGSYRIGNQLQPGTREAAFARVGDMLRALVGLAKVTKVKVPPAQRKVKVKGTILDNLLAVETSIYKLNALLMNAIRANKPLDLPIVGVEAVNALNALYAFSWSAFDRPASEAMDAKVEAMKGEFPAEIFVAPPPRPPPVKLTEEEKAARAAAKKAEADAKAAATPDATPANPQ